MLLYADTIVAQIDERELNDLYGGKEPDISCDGVFSTMDFIGIVVGWQRDLLIAYGITRDFSGMPIALNKLGWAPHQNSLAVHIQGPRDFYDSGNGVHICWDESGDGRWSFGTQQQVGCTAAPPPNQAAETVFAVQL
ncbi:hypothetical protein [Rhizobium leguminosarum]|uniref:hypothetical protein n=1 Tax=Rhizobium leguminosarum TaxID=384 RepID=UPI001AE20B57|nr:hypothetical protein [Rhizobium leguminosarum]MBP2443798.1 hypothetical protein [Rhizobium leguminosarum]